MQRRNFLYNSGILLPAILAIPSLLVAAAKPGMVNVLVVQGAGKADQGHTASVKNAFGGKAEELACKSIRLLTYTGSCFSITTTDNRVIMARKIVFNTFYKIGHSRNIIEIKTLNASFHIKYSMEEGSPEFWSLQAGQFSSEKLQPFVKRKGNAFLCIS